MPPLRAIAQGSAPPALTARRAGKQRGVSARQTGSMSVTCLAIHPALSD